MIKAFLIFCALACFVAAAVLVSHNLKDNYEYEHNIGDRAILKLNGAEGMVVGKADYNKGRYRVRFALKYSKVMDDIIVRPCEITKREDNNSSKRPAK